jgi:hypothetical protein
MILEDIHSIDVYTIENRKIIGAEICMVDEAAENQFWGN